MVAASPSAAAWLGPAAVRVERFCQAPLGAAEGLQRQAHAVQRFLMGQKAVSLLRGEADHLRDQQRLAGQSLRVPLGEGV